MSKTIVYCSQCDSSMERYAGDIYKNNFCNKECKAIWQSMNPSPHLKTTQFKTKDTAGANNHNWSGGPIEIDCSYCGKKLHRHPCRIRKQKRHFCDQKCKGKWQADNMLGENNPRWQGGIIVSKDGYKEIYKPHHDRAKQNGYVFEHILVAEQKYGRKIKISEHVHHLNGIKDDNRQENLVVINPQDHDRLSVRHALQERIRKLENALNHGM